MITASCAAQAVGENPYSGQKPEHLILDKLDGMHFNIIKNEMLLIGPRPALYNQKDLIKKRTEKGIETLAPGITGWAQINGRDELKIDEKIKSLIDNKKNDYGSGGISTKLDAAKIFPELSHLL